MYNFKLGIFLTVLAFGTPGYSQFINMGSLTTFSHNVQNSIQNSNEARRFSRLCSGLNPMFCTMAALSAAQAIKNLDGASKSDDSYQASLHEGNLRTQETIPYSANVGSGFPAIKLNLHSKAEKAKLDQMVSELRNVVSELADRGYSYNAFDDTVKTPKGKFPISQLSTMEGIAAASGASPKDIEEVTKVTDQLNKEAERKLAAMTKGKAEEGTSPAAQRPAGELNAEDDLKDYINQMMAAQRMPAEKTDLTGLSVLRNGEPVGISQGNIFEMISTRYSKLHRSGTIGLKTAPHN